MTQTPPNFTKLSSLNPTKDRTKKATMRPGFYADMLKSKPEQLLTDSTEHLILVDTLPWRTLQNY